MCCWIHYAVVSIANVSVDGYDTNLRRTAPHRSIHTSHTAQTHSIRTFAHALCAPHCGSIRNAIPPERKTNSQPERTRAERAADRTEPRRVWFSIFSFTIDSVLSRRRTGEDALYDFSLFALRCSVLFFVSVFVSSVGVGVCVCFCACAKTVSPWSGIVSAPKFTPVHTVVDFPRVLAYVLSARVRLSVFQRKVKMSLSTIVAVTIICGGATNRLLLPHCRRC